MSHTLHLLLLLAAAMLARVSANQMAELEYEDQLLEEEAAAAEEEERFLFRSPPKRTPCACINPFNGTRLAYIGDRNITCERTKACYVSCYADCADLLPAWGWRRCYSEAACANPTAPAAPAAPAPAAAADIQTPAVAALNVRVAAPTRGLRLP